MPNSRSNRRRDTPNSRSNRRSETRNSCSNRRSDTPNSRANRRSETRNSCSNRRSVMPDSRSRRRTRPSNGRGLEILPFHLARTTGDLHVCPHCDSRLVQPIKWHEPQDGFWKLLLRCPNCRREHQGLFSESQVDAFEEQLEEGLAQMLGDVTRLAQANIAEEVECFCAALRCDLIRPEDF